MLEAILLGIVEGITEFMPVSSSTHLKFFSAFIGFNNPAQELFETVIQLGAILAVCIFFRHRIFATIAGLTRRPAQKLTFNLIISFIPVVLSGLFLHKYIKATSDEFTMLFNLVIGGAVFIFVEKITKKNKFSDVTEFSIWAALMIGLFQCLALFPGVSRSGATIVAALLMGANRKSAVEFSFLLAIPTILAASLYDFYNNIHMVTPESMEIIISGFISAFITALIVIRPLMNFLTSYGLAVFGWYRIIIGLGTMLFFIGAGLLLA